MMKRIIVLLGCVVPMSSFALMEKDQQMPPEIHSKEDIMRLMDKQMSITKEDIKSHIDAIASSLAKIRTLSPTDKQIIADMVKDELGKINRVFTDLKDRIIIALENKSFAGYNPQKSINDIHTNLKGILNNIQSMPAQERTRKISDMANSLNKLQEAVQKSLPKDLLIRLTSLQNKLKVLASSKPLTVQDAFIDAVKRNVAELKKHLKPLKELGLVQEAQELKASIKDFLKSKNIDLAKMKADAIALFEKTQQAYAKSK